MKKRVFIFIFVLSMTAVACGNKSRKIKSEAAVQAVESDSEKPTEDSNSESEGDVSGSGVDLDLTALSSTMVYSEVFNMVASPDDYKGKIIKLEGECNVYTEQTTGKTYYSCLVQDATQCCSNGVEFVLDESEYSLEDYPKTGESITIEGTFSTYEENGAQFITIKDAKLD